MRMMEMPRMKILGSLCLIDQGELDWKILAVEEEFSIEHNIRSVDDYNQYHPGAIREVKEWFRTIKTHDGKPENRFGRDGRVLGVEETLEIIFENNNSYQKLMIGVIPNQNEELWLNNDNVNGNINK